MNIRYIYLFVLALGFFACDEDDNILPEEVILPELTAGSADFSNYIAVGASFTAGFTDGGLFKASQENSFPNILSKQFAKAGGGTFTQPLMNDNTGGILVGGNVIRGYRLTFNSDIPGPQSLDAFLTGLGAPVPPITTEAGVSIGSDFNNFGIPGAKSWHLVAPGYAGLNPFYARIASAPTATVLTDAMAQNPTFFTLSEIGGNDVLGYATSGGDGSNLITDSATFNDALNALITGLTSGGAKGVVTNVPFITDLPHFTTVPHNPIPLDTETAAFLNSAAAYGAYNAGIQGAFAFLVANTPLTQELADIEIAKRTITFEASENNAVVIMDESLTDLTGLNEDLVSMRQATAEDLFVLPASSFIGTEGVLGVNGVAVPLADKWVLIPEEQEEIKEATDAYNTTIAAVANANDAIALVDLNAILSETASTGIDFDGFNLNADLVTGGAVGLDGIHLTARGYAYLANKFLEAIDTAFGSNFIESGNIAKANDYPTNYSPTLQ
ncbi:SGNH/GDSL hydrolase family protein [Flavivirga rizhaonensis]|uniref:G-D-S-L family lipolytic protein n=1 Tax=Flavivirga rizhaonensis TaxID=2559571 RepID=A0A4S1DXQ2_9FLAO|nr:SGNH/GDSL hydrolase family protein [Flavivirga rizhaonensis]TGV02302.1 G-D-S-L family lipolytic protein [Flavivirga rizhaonensis]